jgi:hypothetical protein
VFWEILFVPGAKLCTPAEIAAGGPCHPVTTSDRFSFWETIILPPIVLIALGVAGFWIVRWVARGFRSS